MSDRMDQVRDLLVAELRDRGDIDDEDHVGHVVGLAYVSREVEGGRMGWVHALPTTEDPDDPIVLGIIEHRQVQQRARIGHTVTTLLDADLLDDDENGLDEDEPK